MLFTLNNDTVPRVEGYDDNEPKSTVSFSCPPGFILTGPDSVTCSGSGEWEPDLRGIMCINPESQYTKKIMIITNPIPHTDSHTFPYHTESITRLTCTADE